MAGMPACAKQLFGFSCMEHILCQKRGGGHGGRLGNANKPPGASIPIRKTRDEEHIRQDGGGNSTCHRILSPQVRSLVRSLGAHSAWLLMLCAGGLPSLFVCRFFA